MEHKEDSPKPSSPSDESNLMGDHVYDGIQEYDNPLPRWWTLIFWGTFVFSIGYYFHYHIGPRGQSVAEGYAADVRAADEIAAKRAAKETVSEELLASLVQNTAAVAQGSELFTSRCAVCHGPKGEGLIGPNLTDGHWVHGKGALMDIYKTTAEGVDAKGMPGWAKQLSAEELRSVVSFVGTVRNTNLPGKAPEGTSHAPAP